MISTLNLRDSILASLCTNQLWCSLVLWCSTWLEESRDYKIVTFGYVKLKLWIKWDRKVSNTIEFVQPNFIQKPWNVFTYLCSTLRKLSKYIKFIKFECVDLQIWSCKVFTYFWIGKRKIETCRAMWLFPTGWYQVCARAKSNIFWFHTVLHVLIIPESTNL